MRLWEPRAGYQIALVVHSRAFVEELFGAAGIAIGLVADKECPSASLFGRSVTVALIAGNETRLVVGSAGLSCRSAAVAWIILVWLD